MTDISGIDCIIVGTGFCGSVIARKLAENDKKVLLLERRNHIAGNMYDEIDSNGILVQRYGPHIFHTNNKEVFDFIKKYGTWIDYHHKPAVELNGIITPVPSNFLTIDLLYNKEEAETLKKRLRSCYDGQKTVTILELLACKDEIIKKYAEKLYELNYLPYTVKQWGISPNEIDPSVLKRVPVRLDYTEGYFDDEFQCMPGESYTKFFGSLLDHKNVKVMLNTDALKTLTIDTKKKKIYFGSKPISIPVVYTGAIDELLEYSYGQLPYRSLRFDYQTRNVDSFQEASVVVYPRAEGYTRITEYKKLPPQDIPEITTVAYEYPLPTDKTNCSEPYYPILTDDNISLYNKYKSDIDRVPNIYLCGRLADYKYYNMDVVILRAFDVFRKIFLKKRQMNDSISSKSY
jgi:UDP-galactopyranose mutase